MHQKLSTPFNRWVFVMLNQQKHQSTIPIRNPFHKFTGRYSPVRRASEGSRQMHHPAPSGLLHEYALLQKGCGSGVGGAAVTKASLLLSAPSPLDNSISLPGA